jgi:hypothetical protein
MLPSGGIHLALVLHLGCIPEKCGCKSRSCKPEMIFPSENRGQHNNSQAWSIKPRRREHKLRRVIDKGH